MGEVIKVHFLQHLDKAVLLLISLAHDDSYSRDAFIPPYGLYRDLSVDELNLAREGPFGQPLLNRARFGLDQLPCYQRVKFFDEVSGEIVGVSMGHEDVF